VFLNPPDGGEAKRWVAKLAEHGNGIALVPPRMGAAWFQDLVLGQSDAVLFLRCPRIAFINARTKEPDRNNNADSVLIAFGKENVEALKKCGLKGFIWQNPRRLRNK
jgi:uncharacterized C2H2 Zn-finger protein